MHITYDASADAAYVQLVTDIGPGEAVSQHVVELPQHAATLVLDFDNKGLLLGIEILGASVVLRQQVRDEALPL